MTGYPCESPATESVTGRCAASCEPVRSCFALSIAIASNTVLLQCALCRRLDMNQ
jgi:hypothetical protein